jgi:hypothetical protein
MFAAAICFTLSSCAGYRGGWESIPYIGSQPPTPSVSRTNYERGERQKLALPGLSLSVMLNNQSIDSDTQVYAYVVPVPGYSVDTPSDAPKKAQVTLFIKPGEEGFVFRPLLTTLSVGGRSASGLGGYTTKQLLRFEGGKAVWDDPKRIADEFPLSSGKFYALYVEFPLPAPSPQAPDVSLDLSKALQAPGQPAIPLIRFLPVRWGNWYG